MGEIYRKSYHRICDYSTCLILKGCNWEESVTFYPEKCHSKNQACYSRTLHGKYCVTDDKLKNCVGCEQCPLGEALEFFHGCPDINGSTWRGGDIRPKMSDSMFDSDVYQMTNSTDKYRDSLGWLCMSRDKCKELYGSNTIFHCDDEKCQSGSCFAPRS